jgi:hypothetical protein
VFVVLHGLLVVTCGDQTYEIPQHASITIAAQTVSQYILFGAHEIVPTLLFFTKYDVPPPSGGTSPSSLVVPFDTKQYAATRKKQRAYVQRVRDTFIDAERSLLRLIDFDKEKKKVEAEGHDVLLHTQLEEMALRESYNRTFYCTMESSEFVDIGTQQRRDRLVPWCTLSCNFCCQTKDEWELQVHNLYDEQQRALGTVVLATHADLLTVFVAEREVIALQEKFDLRVLAHQASERNVCIDVETAERAALRQEQTIERRDLVQRVDLFNVAAKTFQESANLAVREYEVHRTMLDVCLRESKIQKRQFELLEQEETCMRQRMSTQEDMTRTSTRSKLAQATGRTKLREQELDFESVLNERNKLRTECAAHEQRIVDASMQELVKAQQELEEEYELLKRLKKSKTDTTPALCAKCGGLAPDALLHRTTDCPKRPAECKLCKKVFYASEVDAHQGNVCPQRPLECEKCHSYYKAFYWEEHIANCILIASARELLSKCLPTISIQIGDTTHDGGAVVKHVDPGSEMERKGLVPGDALLSVGGKPTPNKKEAEAILNAVAIGSTLEIFVMSMEGTRFSLTWIVQTIVPLDKYKACSQMATKDAQHQTKPPPKKKAPKK